MGCCGSSKKSEQQDNGNKNANLSPIDQLKVRLANGEIKIEEFLKTKAVLEE
jgi:uncharacterized membrane protein